MNFVPTVVTKLLMNSVLVKKWMSDKGMRPEELAVKLGVSFYTVRTMLKGKNPYRPAIIILAGLMGVPEEEILDLPSKTSGGKKPPAS